PSRKRNFVRLLFTDPDMRTLYVAWESVAHACVRQLRTEGAKCPGDARLAELVGELSVVDEQFRRWWGAPRATPVPVGTRTLRHPLVGELVLNWESFTCTADPEQSLVIWAPEAGTPSRDSLQLLSSWITQPPGSLTSAP
ncbi:transcriptional regulator, partial [Streptomyces sp. NPDC007162]